MGKELTEKQKKYLYSDKNLVRMNHFSFKNKEIPLEKRLIKNCQYCENLCKRPGSKFCSSKCWGIYTRGKNHPLYGKKREDSSKMMKLNNPMKNKDAVKKMLQTIKIKYPNWGSFNIGIKKPFLSERNRLNIKKGEDAPMFGKKHSSGTKSKISKTKKEYFLKNPLTEEQKRDIIVRTRKGNWKGKITFPESKLIKIIKKFGLNYNYVGDGKLLVGNLNPDFVNCNGKNVVIEVFGDYWHDPLKNKQCSYNRTEDGRKEFLKRYGWKCLVLWENEIKSLTEEEIVKKIIEFENFSI